MAATEIEADEVQAGAEVLVWSDSEDGADFVASRVVVQPADDEAGPDDAPADDAAPKRPEARQPGPASADGARDKLS